MLRRSFHVLIENWKNILYIEEEFPNLRANLSLLSLSLSLSVSVRSIGNFSTSTTTSIENSNSFTFEGPPSGYTSRGHLPWHSRIPRRHPSVPRRRGIGGYRGTQVGKGHAHAPRRSSTPASGYRCQGQGAAPLQLPGQSELHRNMSPFIRS